MLNFAVSKITHASRLTLVSLPEETESFYLKEKLHSLDWGDGCFGDSSGDATGQEVLGERNSCLIHGAMFLVCLSDNSTIDIPHCPLQLMACTDEMADCEEALRIYVTQLIAIQYEKCDLRILAHPSGHAALRQ